MNPTFMFMDAPINKPFYDRGIIPAIMGCRTYVCSNINGQEGPEGRGNIAPVTMNLPRLAIEAKGDWNKFFKNLRKLMNLCAEQLMHRYDVLKELKVKDLPFVAGQHLMVGSEGLGPDDSIEPILKQGTWGIGFIGIAEVLLAMDGKHHGQDEEQYEKALNIVKTMREIVDGFKEQYKLNFSLYATPAEGVCGRFPKLDKKKFGVIPGITDKGYYTNSYHIPVNFNIPALKKLDIEGKFHTLCNAGHISYVELDGGDWEDRKEFIHRCINHIIEDPECEISYAGFNFHMRYCKHCGQELYEHVYKCDCGCTDIQGVSRVTGYLSLDERFAPGKVAEREQRVKHQ